MESHTDIASSGEEAKNETRQDNTSPSHSFVESNERTLIPFRGRVANKHFYDTQSGESPHKKIDVCDFREGLVQPLTLKECSQVGEFTPSQWQQHHSKLAQKSDQILMDSERICQANSEMSSQIQAKTATLQEETTKLLDERVKQILDGRERLSLHIEKTTLELRLLNEMRKRLQLALLGLELPEDTNEECIKIRRYRHGIDNTKDELFLALVKEKEVLRTDREVLSTSLSEIKEAIFRLAEIKRLLEHDWSDKQETMQIDHRASKLQFRTNIVQFKPVSEALNEGTSTPSSWLNQVNAHEATSRRELAIDSQLRELANNALRAVANDVLEAYEATDTALNNRLGSLEISIAELKTASGKIRREISVQEETIKELRQQLQDKECPLRVAQTRYYDRSFRPGIDRCLDLPHYSLNRELEELPQSIDTLRTCVGRSEETLEELHREQENLLNNIMGREHTLSLEKRCVAVRKVKPSAKSLQCF